MTIPYGYQPVGAWCCPYCSTATQQIAHGGPCPRVKAIEYHPWGGIKRVEFHEPRGVSFPVSPPEGEPREGGVSR